MSYDWSTLQETLYSVLKKAHHNYVQFLYLINYGPGTRTQILQTNRFVLNSKQLYDDSSKVRYGVRVFAYTIQHTNH